MAASEMSLPHWDMSVVYPGLESTEFAEGFEKVVRSIEQLVALFDHHEIFGGERLPVDERILAAIDEILDRLNEVLDEVITLHSYILSFVATNSRHELAQARLSELQGYLMKLSQLEKRLIAWLGRVDIESILPRSEIARTHAFMLRKAKRQADHLMSAAEEELATELDMTGGTAWTKLYHTFSSQISVTLEIEGQPQELPMSAVRNLAYEPDRALRRRAYEAEIAAWKRSVVPIAAALNGIKGQVNTLTRRRGWESPLEASLFDNNMNRQALDAMMDAAYESFDDFRRYLQAKAKALGLERLAWYDLFAPVGTDSRTWQYSEATQFIVEQFGTYSPRLRELAERAFRENWIDAEPRAGKSDGGFCNTLRADESRILVNYKPTFGQVSTLAHELGHAYHNLNLARRPALLRETPMPLAETASTFCETLIQQAGLEEASPQERLTLLENSLKNACQVVLDITSRFLFEQALFEKRWNRELTPDELCELMLNAQRETYGAALDPETLHPYMWAAKPHYYSPGFSFYNYPYMFGMLFGLGLYAHYQEDPEGFPESYDDLLASTGLADCAELGHRFGIDIESPTFWRSSLDVIRADIERFETLVGTMDTI